MLDSTAAVTTDAAVFLPAGQELRILLLEDLVADAELVRHELRRAQVACTLHRVETEAEFLRALTDFHPHLILADYSLPTFDGMAALALALERVPDVPFIFVSGTLGEELAIETLKGGATDYVLKQRIERLVPSVQRALREAQERLERKRAEQQLEFSFTQVRALAAHLESIREEERARIAREIHDELGQALTGLKFDLAWLQKHLKQSALPQCQDKVCIMLELVDTTIQLGRKIAMELRPGILDDLGLVDALEWQAKEFAARTGIHCEFVSLPTELPLDQARTTTLFRIFQETLTNVARHAQADQVSIELCAQPDRITLVMRDNGRGITEQEKQHLRSFGLLGMRERALSVGGTVLIHGQPGQGTAVTVHVPVAEAGGRWR